MAAAEEEEEDLLMWRRPRRDAVQKKGKDPLTSANDLLFVRSFVRSLVCSFIW